MTGELHAIGVRLRSLRYGRATAGQAWHRGPFGDGRQGGWTLIEMVVVISMMVLLAGIAMTNYRNAVTRTQEAVLKENLFRIRDSIDQYYADKGKYPATLDTLVSDGYLRRLPEDPITRASDWQIIQAEPDPSNPTAETGVFDVKSASDRMSLEGKPYNEW